MAQESAGNPTLGFASGDSDPRIPFQSSRHYRLNLSASRNGGTLPNESLERSWAIAYAFRAPCHLSNLPAHLMAHAAMRLRIALAIRTRSSPTGYGKPRLPA